MKLLARASASRRGPGSRSAIGTARAAALLGSLFVAFVGSSAGAESARPGADASLAEIERCVTDSLLPESWCMGGGGGSGDGSGNDGWLVDYEGS